MTPAERQQRHRANLERIDRVQRVVGQGDRMRIDHEGTLLERARLLVEEVRSHEATELGLIAFDRLLRRAEDGDLRHRRDIIIFIDAIWRNKALPVVTLRGLDMAVADDMLAVLDAYRHARINLPLHVHGGPARLARVVGQASAAPAAAG